MPYNVVNTRGAVDEAAADELFLFASSDRDLYRQAQRSYIPNMSRRLRNRSYDGEKAIKLWFYFANTAAERYRKLFGGHFNVATRMNVARQFRDHYFDEASEQALVN